MRDAFQGQIYWAIDKEVIALYIDGPKMSKGMKLACLSYKFSYIIAVAYQIYLGVFIVRANKFKCSIDQAKRAFFRAANSIFAKVGRLASEEVIVQLLKQKYITLFTVNGRKK